MNSRIYTGSLWHRRRAPVEHTFRYPSAFFGFDLDELPQLHRKVRGFAHNHFAVVSLRDGDYLDPGDQPLRQKLRPYLEGLQPRRITLITSARYCGYAFNPVSFYLCFDGADQLSAVVVEVNNTFGDRHLYLLTDFGRDDRGAWIDRHRKEFHVSPFHDMSGTYRFAFHLGEEALRIEIAMEKDGCDVFQATWGGAARVFTSAALARTLLRFPLNTLLTMPRILAQAARLHFRKKLAYHPRPEPEHPRTIRQRELK